MMVMSLSAVKQMYQYAAAEVQNQNQMLIILMTGIPHLMMITTMKMTIHLMITMMLTAAVQMIICQIMIAILRLRARNNQVIIKSKMKVIITVIMIHSTKMKLIVMTIHFITTIRVIAWIVFSVDLAFSNQNTAGASVK